MYIPKLFAIAALLLPHTLGQTTSTTETSITQTTTATTTLTVLRVATNDNYGALIDTTSPTLSATPASSYALTTSLYTSSATALPTIYYNGTTMSRHVSSSAVSGSNGGVLPYPTNIQPATGSASRVLNLRQDQLLCFAVIVSIVMYVAV